MELLEGVARVDHLTPPSVASLPLPLALTLPHPPFAAATRTEESEKSETLSLSLPFGWRDPLVSALNATYRLECEARAPLIHRQGRMNIYKKLRNIVASLVLSLLRVYNRSRCIIVPLQSTVADSPGCPLLYFLCFSVSLMR